MSMICAVFRIALERVCVVGSATRSKAGSLAIVLHKREPKTRHSDEPVLDEVALVLTASSFITEGHGKVRAKQDPDRGANSAHFHGRMIKQPLCAGNRSRYSRCLVGCLAALL
jgi:hypothetical protein